jgi:hypothetical protein
MQKVIVLLMVVTVALLFTGGHCHKVIRDEAVYRTELDFLEQLATQQAILLTGFIKGNCSCIEGKFTTEPCQKTADTVLVVQSRVKWHKDMMLYNAGLLKERPPKDPPAIPEAKTLCP